MPYRYDPSYKDNFYHVYNRGNNRQNIFIEEKNYDYFLYKIVKYFLEKIDITAYCLMPNHFHLLIEAKEDCALEEAMQKFSNSYTKSINSRYGRVGHLFQGRYKSKLIPGNDYLIHLSRYIHLNPVRARLVRKPENWKHSSYSHFVGKTQIDFLKPDMILNQFNNVDNYQKFTMDFDELQKHYVKDLMF